MTLFSKETAAIVKREQGKFTSKNYTTKIKQYGGFSTYVRSLGGVFTKYYGESLIAKTATEFKEICEYVCGLMCIFGFAYWNGKTWWYFMNNTAKCFYANKITNKGCRGGTIFQLCTGADDRLRITNCNYGVDTLLKQLGLYKTSSDSIKTWAKKYGKPVTSKSKLQRGDIVHYFGKSLDRSNPDTWKDWHHVTMVYEVKDGKIWMVDFGNRFIKSGEPLHYMPVDSSAKAGGEYSSYYWAAIHAFNFVEDEKPDKDDDDMAREKTIADKAVELKRGIEAFMDVKEIEYGEEVFNLAMKYITNKDVYLRAAADYVFEGFAGSGDARKVFFGDDYDEMQAKVTWIWKVANIFKNNADKDVLKQILGDDYDVVQNELNRLNEG